VPALFADLRKQKELSLGDRRGNSLFVSAALRILIFSLLGSGTKRFGKQRYLVEGAEK